MPTYEYACTSCGHRLEVNQSFSDDPLTTCPECGGALRKVFGSVGIVLKGPGFYRTDSRGSSRRTASKDGGTEKAAPAATAGVTNGDGSGGSTSSTSTSSDSASSSSGSGSASSSPSSGSSTKTAAS